MADKRRTFTKTIDGQQATTIATTPADAVRLRFNGWREQRPQPTPEPTPTPAPAAEPAASKPTTTVTAAAASRPKAKTDGEDTSRNEVSA